MYLLKKVFDVRDSSNPEGEKPFLDHLEDLRIMVLRVVLTLLVTTIACFVFKGQLLEIIRKPVEALWTSDQKEKLKGLPVEIELEIWEKAKVAAISGEVLTAKEQKIYESILGAEGEDFHFHVKVAGYYRALMALPSDDQRKAFMKEMPLSAETTEQLEVLYERGKDGKGPETEVGAKERMVKMQALKPTETFMLSIKLAFFAGIVVAFPLLLYFILQFILPGLYQKEKKVLYGALGIGLGLFLLGVLFAYGFVLPRMLAFFHDYSGGMGIGNDWRIGEYITFATQFVLIFGLAFELPVVVMAFVKLGLLSYETMSRTRSYAIISILVIAAIITPTPDAGTLMMLAVPMYLLYEICIWLAYFMRDKEESGDSKGAEAAALIEEDESEAEKEPEILPYAEFEEEHEDHDLDDDDDHFAEHQDDDYHAEMEGYGDEDSSDKDQKPESGD